MLRPAEVWQRSNSTFGCARGKPYLCRFSRRRPCHRSRVVLGISPALVDCLRLVEAMLSEGLAVGRCQNTNLFTRCTGKKSFNPLTSSSSETQNRLRS